MWERNPQRATEHLAQVVTLNRAAMAEMRSLLLELRPETILRTNLSHLLDQLFRAVKGRKTMHTDLVIEGQEYFLPPEVHVAFYRIAQEAINNSVKHSQATHITAHLVMSEESTTLTLQDNGQGFDASISMSGMGLHTMRERAVGAGLHFELHSQVGDGTHIKITWTQPS
jgi:signal transduction histidine kinase